MPVSVAVGCPSKQKAWSKGTKDASRLMIGHITLMVPKG